MKLRKWRLLIGGTNSRIETFLPCFMHILFFCICRLHVKMTYFDNQFIDFILLFLFNNLIYVSYFLVNWAMNNVENIYIHDVHVVQRYICIRNVSGIF